MGNDRVEASNELSKPIPKQPCAVIFPQGAEGGAVFGVRRKSLGQAKQLISVCVSNDGGCNPLAARGAEAWRCACAR
eukprot:165797-Pleurochrysis_carterae.AAC.1